MKLTDFFKITQENEVFVENKLEPHKSISLKIPLISNTKLLYECSLNPDVDRITLIEIVQSGFLYDYFKDHGFFPSERVTDYVNSLNDIYSTVNILVHEKFSDLENLTGCNYNLIRYKSNSLAHNTMFIIMGNAPIGYQCIETNHYGLAVTDPSRVIAFNLYKFKVSDIINIPQNSVVEN